MDIWDTLISGVKNTLTTVQQASYIRLNTDDTDTDTNSDKIVDIWSDIDENKRNAPLPKMISISGKIYISLEGGSPPYESTGHQVTPKILTSTGYLNSTELRKKTDQTHLQFTNKTYFEHLNESMTFCGKSASSGCFFFINGLFPECFPYTATDKIILLSENILEKYSDVLDNQALLATGVRVGTEDKGKGKETQPKPISPPNTLSNTSLPSPIKIPGNKTRLQHLFE
jgi:hypothetical protein